MVEKLANWSLTEAQRLTPMIQVIGGFAARRSGGGPGAGFAFDSTTRAGTRDSGTSGIAALAVAVAPRPRLPASGLLPTLFA